MPFKGSAAATSLYLCLCALLVANSTSCWVRRRNITRKGGQATQTLLTTDKDSLIKEIDEDYAAYILTVVTHTPGGQPLLGRQLWFDRLRLQLVRQLIFDASGDILTDARYSDWQVYENVPFPKTIDINRPKDEYGVVLTV